MAGRSSNEIRVFISHRENDCAECGTELHRGEFVVLHPEQGARCLACEDLDHLVYLPAGDAALSRRARKHSKLSAVVMKFSRARKRSERQGILLEEEALQRAEEECLADEDARMKRREREAERREKLDAEYVDTFASEVRKLFPGCPDGKEQQIAEHACLKYSGRVGRSSAAKNFEPWMIELAVRAHIRHAETSYDELLSTGYPRDEARAMIAADVNEIIENWESKPSS